MPVAPSKESYETEAECPQCAKSPPPKMYCNFETVFAGSNKTRHLECKKCGYRTQDVVNNLGHVIMSKDLERKRGQ